MNVYITYDRYEHDEWYSVYHIETNKKRAIKHFLENDLFNFLTYGPDDCHAFQLQKVIMTPKEYNKLCELVKMEKDGESCSEKELKEILIAIFDETWENEVETIYFTDGCSDYIEITDFYIENYDTELDPNEFEDEDDYKEAVMEKIFNDEELLKRILKKYIKATY